MDWSRLTSFPVADALLILFIIIGVAIIDYGTPASIIDAWLFLGFLLVLLGAFWLIAPPDMGLPSEDPTGPYHGAVESYQRPIKETGEDDWVNGLRLMLTGTILMVAFAVALSLGVTF